MKHEVHSFPDFNEFIIIDFYLILVTAICPRVVFNENARKWSHDTQQPKVSENN